MILSNSLASHPRIRREAAVNRDADARHERSRLIVQQIQDGSHDLFLSEIENVYVKPDLLDEKGALHLERADLVSYAHGRYYGLTREALGFFGYSVARPDVLSRRLAKDGPHKKERRK